MNPDPLGISATELSKPQSLDQYAYVMNSPLGFVDPLGLDTQTIFAGNCIWQSQSFHEMTSEAMQDPETGQTIYVFHDQVSWTGFSPILCHKQVQANWTLNFIKSFFTFAGGPRNVPTCAGQTLRHMGEVLNPFSPGPATAADVAAPAAQAVAINRGMAQTQAAVDAYVATKGLTVPLRSSIVRKMIADGAGDAVAAGGRANVATATLAVDYAAVSSGYQTMGEARDGTCAAAFPIF